MTAAAIKDLHCKLINQLPDKVTEENVFDTAIGLGAGILRMLSEIAYQLALMNESGKPVSGEGR